MSDLISPKKVVEIVEVGPRDGLQNEAMIIPVSAKLRYITALVEESLPEHETEFSAMKNSRERPAHDHSSGQLAG